MTLSGSQGESGTTYRGYDPQYVEAEGIFDTVFINHSGDN